MSKDPTTANPALAQDEVVFSSSSTAPFPITSLENDVDPITKAIRDEIIIKQQEYLQRQIAESIKEEQEKEAFRKKNFIELRDYLASEQGKDAVKEVMKNAETQLAMNEIEVDGYKKIHEDFKDRFSNVGWSQQGGNEVRSAEIKNAEGEVVTTLKEKTFDTAPIQVTLEDGTQKKINSYRQIDFPIKLENGKGPLHLSMAAKDEGGRNIAAKDAVYFTAHYDENGKLTEVSSPVPVKFMGKGEDAIGYIERDGKVYTLPVTQGKYNEMMLEVSKNNGLGVNLGLAQEQQRAVDVVSLKEPAASRKELQPEKAVEMEASVAKEATLVNPEGRRSKSMPEPLKATTATTIEPPLSKRGSVLSPAVEAQAKKIGESIPQPPSQEEMEQKRLQLKEEAAKLLENKVADQVPKIISDKVRAGEPELVGAMMNYIKEKDPTGKWSKEGKIALQSAYWDTMGLAENEKDKTKRIRLEKAAGEIVEAADIKGHRTRASSLEPKKASKYR